MEEETFGIDISTNNNLLDSEEIQSIDVGDDSLVEENIVNNMAVISDVKDMDVSVFEYKKAEQEVRNGFIAGIIGLGKILAEQREYWKPQRKWRDFLDKAQLSVAGSNQMIRIYEYSKDNFEKLKQAGITNWERVNLFLALDDEEKYELAEKIGGEEVKNSMFKEAINEFKEELVSLEDIDEEKLLSLMNKTVLKNIPLTARMLVKNISKEKKMSPKCSPLAEAFLYVQKTMLLLNDNYDNLSKEDVIFWKNLIKKQIKVLNDIK